MKSCAYIGGAPWHRSCPDQILVASDIAGRAKARARTADSSLPLAKASERLRDVPGFPRRRGRPRAQGQHDRGSAPALSTDAVVARLLDVVAAAAYLGVSPWTIRDLNANGTLKRVRIPLRDSDLRKLL